MNNVIDNMDIFYVSCVADFDSNDSSVDNSYDIDMIIPALSKKPNIIKTLIQRNFINPRNIKIIKVNNNLINRCDYNDKYPWMSILLDIYDDSWIFDDNKFIHNGCPVDRASVHYTKSDGNDYYDYLIPSGGCQPITIWD